ncbi:hypothetical protein JG687_00004505 [Phytophthora cactorum]|uniref:Uncharacterized protein n=1 Tax=Phytophthora cactorum TaxID=29920 RepID=A0A8T1UT42_9STRA|nr:hypothetical protein JG687_00004505 [Phytophthora cactorum]
MCALWHPSLWVTTLQTAFSPQSTAPSISIPAFTTTTGFSRSIFNTRIDATMSTVTSSPTRWNLRSGVDSRQRVSTERQSGCKGYKAIITLPHFGGIRDFDVQKVKGAINSFTVMSVTKLVNNGFSNVCSWTGSNVDGGYVAEDNTINMVNATVS